MMKVADDKVVTIAYTVSDGGGEVLDSSEGKEPLSYIHGKGNIIPGLENSLSGKSEGDSFKISIPPSEAYGERDESKVIVLGRDQFEGVEQLEVGMQFRAQSNAGPQLVTITGIEEEKVTVDANHPLAGLTLNFDVTVVGVRDATSEELSHGHIHGPDGHHH